MRKRLAIILGGLLFFVVIGAAFGNPPKKANVNLSTAPAKSTSQSQHEKSTSTSVSSQSSQATTTAPATSSTNNSTSTPTNTSPSTQSPPQQQSCTPLTNGGNCYEPGEYCRNSDHGASGVAGNGESITCEDNNGWRWEPS